MINKLQATLYPWNETSQTWDSGIVVTYAYDIKANQSLGEMNDTWSFKISNVRNIYSDYFTPMDRVEIYELINGASIASSNMIMNGLLKTVTEDITENGKTLRIEGKSFGEMATNAIVFFNTPVSHSLNVFQFIEGCLESIKLFDSKFGITGINYPTLKTSGGAFPILRGGQQIKEFNKSFAYIMKTYLIPDNTGDGLYYWYVDNNKILQIKPRLGTLIKTTWSEGVDFKTARFRRNTEDIKNFIVVKCGLDKNNDPITTRYDDAASRAKYGFKYYMIVDMSISSKVIAAYPSWTNDQVRTEAIAQGKEAGRTFANAHNKGLIELSVTMAPTVSYQVGDLIRINAPSYNLSNYSMRIKSIDWDIEGTDITLVEEVTL